MAICRQLQFKSERRKETVAICWDLAVCQKNEPEAFQTECKKHFNINYSEPVKNLFTQTCWAAFRVS